MCLPCRVPELARPAALARHSRAFFIGGKKSVREGAAGPGSIGLPDFHTPAPLPPTTLLSVSSQAMLV
jgi:hypothetical protein